MPTRLPARIQAVAREVTIGFKEIYECDGVSSRQQMNLRETRMCGTTTCMSSRDGKATDFISNAGDPRVRKREDPIPSAFERG